MPAVADTSTLAALSAIGQTRLLNAIFGRILIPPAVFDELVTDGEGWEHAAEVQRVIREEDWIEMCQGELPPDLHALAGLGRGETEAIALALRLRFPLLTNDQKARRRGEALGVEVRGSLGVLELAKYLGLIHEAKPLVFAMRDAGIHLSDEIINEFLTKLDEV